MKPSIRLMPVLLGLWVVLAACGARPAPAAMPPTEAAVPLAVPDAGTAATETPAAHQSTPADPTAAPAGGATEAASTDWLNTVTVQGDYYVLGNPAASVRLIDFSDFL